MLFANLTTEQLDHLRQEIKQTKKLKRFRRLSVIHGSGQKKRFLTWHKHSISMKPTVRRYIHEFNESGFSSFEPGQHTGRPAKLSWSKANWDDLLAQSPKDFDKLESGALNWTQPLVCRYFAHYHELTISQGAISKALKTVGISWRRARLRVHSPDPLYVVKRQRVEEMRQMALSGELSPAKATHPPPDGTGKATYLAYFDATDLHWCPTVGSTYQSRGEQVKVDSPGKENPWYALLGSLVFPSGDGHYTIHDRKRSNEFLSHLQGMIDRDPNGFWFVILDNASAHKTAQVKQFEIEHQHCLELVFLPTYSPHLNLIERLWRVLKYQVTRNVFFESLTDLALAVQSWLEQLSFEQSCSILGIDADDLRFL